MTYFCGKQKHYRLSDLKQDTFAIAVFSENVFFLEFSSLSSMYHWYRSVPDKRCHEIIRSESRKLVLDIDGDCNIDTITKYLENFFGGDAGIILYQSHGPIKTSWHVVVSNYYFENYNYCKYVASCIPSKNIDLAVYSSTQFLRMEGSHKNGRVKMRTGYHGLSPLSKFKEGIISYTDGATKMVIKIPKLTVSNASAKEVDYDKTAFKVRSQNGHITFLDRIRPSYCTICERVHDSENMAIINGKLVCWRNF